MLVRSGFWPSLSRGAPHTSRVHHSSNIHKVRGVAMNVVTTAIITSMVKSRGEIMPKSRPTFKTMSSTEPLEFKRLPIAPVSRKLNPDRRAIKYAPFTGARRDQNQGAADEGGGALKRCRCTSRTWSFWLPPVRYLFGICVCAARPARARSIAAGTFFSLWLPKTRRVAKSLALALPEGS
jgi:hypothetical protein